MLQQKLHKDYRIKETTKIRKLIGIGECFEIYSPVGMGKSRYLRHIADNNIVSDTKLFYIDLNSTFTKDIHPFLKILAQTIDAVSPKAEAILQKFKDYLKDYKQVYLIFDHAEELEKLEKDEIIKFLKYVRDSLEKKLGYIVATEKEKHKLSELLRIADIKVTFGPLDKSEYINLINHFEKTNKEKFTTEEVEILWEYSKGTPKLIKTGLSYKLLKFDFTELVKKSDKSVNNDEILNLAHKTLTNNEFKVFEEMYQNIGKVITRDRIANILSPQSEGAGVSNEAIDQIVSRLRKRVKALNIDINVINKRGVGYYIE